MSPRLLSTKDYSKFELCQFNRSVSKKRYLLSSMRDHGFIPAYPIHCIKSDSNRLQIKGGHHRFECAQELGIAVFYVVSGDDATIHELEKSTNRWTVADYMESHIRCGVSGYSRVKEYQSQTGITLNMCISILGGESASSSNLSQKFKDGVFVIRGEQHAAGIKEVVLFCKDAGIAVDQHFVHALSRCLRVNEFSVDVFKVRAANNVSMFYKCRTLCVQMQLFEDVYNFKATAKTRLPLCFLADQVMRDRQVNGMNKPGQTGLTDE